MQVIGSGLQQQFSTLEEPPRANGISANLIHFGVLIRLFVNDSIILISGFLGTKLTRKSNCKAQWNETRE
jgi:hypothetical protein